MSLVYHSHHFNHTPLGDALEHCLTVLYSPLALVASSVKCQVSARSSFKAQRRFHLILCRDSPLTLGLRRHLARQHDPTHTPSHPGDSRPVPISPSHPPASSSSRKVPLAERHHRSRHSAHITRLRPASTHRQHPHARSRPRRGEPAAPARWQRPDGPVEGDQRDQPRG